MAVERSALLTEFTAQVGVPEEELSRIEPSRELCDELLDPEAWRPILEMYAGTMKLAIALTDPEGRLLGRCHNPQPIWRMARGETPELEGGCSFCLAPPGPCDALADALSTGEVAMVTDRAGLTHVAVPLTLCGQPFGALLAGQVLSRYPEPLPLQVIARKFGVSQQALWHEAIRQVPITRANLKVYGTLLMTMGRAFLGQRYAGILHKRLVETNGTIGRALQEKEVLLREIHHRVKNNLQIISALLNMQVQYLDDIKDARAIEALEGSQQRIAAMSYIHNLLYGTHQVGEIDLAGYVKDLAEEVISSFQSSDIRIRSLFDLTPVFIDMRQAIPCGLIVNELITNVFKYAYPNEAAGEICIYVKPMADNRVALTVADQGVGMANKLDKLDKLDSKHSDSLGLRIIGILSKQIGATYRLDAQQGVSVTLEFPRHKNALEAV